MSDKHLEPGSQPAPSPRLLKSLPRKKGVGLTAGLAAVAFVLGVGGLLSGWWSNGADSIPSANRHQLEQAFTTMPPVRLEAVSAQDQSQALDTMHLDPPQLSQLLSRIDPALPASAGRARLAWLEVWDFATEDGDVVRISSAGFSQDVTLLNRHARIAIPVDAGQRLTVTGVHDGGGGITLGVLSAATPVSLPVLAPGQAISITVGL